MLVYICRIKFIHMSNNKSTSSGTSTLGLLGVSFVILKLTGYINWSWWLVTLPFWGGLAILLIICLVALIIAAFKYW